MARILCVDDDPSILAGLKAALSIRGHEVFTAESEDGAIAAIPEHRPDLIICDVMMPEGSEGFEVVWWLRALHDRVLAETPVIMATGTEDLSELCYYPDESEGPPNPLDFLPVQDWLDKPFSNNDLYAAIERVLCT